MQVVMQTADLISAGLAGLFEVWVEAGMAVAAAVLLADLGQLLHPGPGCTQMSPFVNNSLIYFSHNTLSYQKKQ